MKMDVMFFAPDAILLALKLIIVSLTVTSFVPDEYYQYNEPAYNLVFGCGVLSWEWQPEYRIRSFVFLIPCITAYLVEHSLGIDSTTVVSLTPRVIHAIIASVGEASFYRVLCKWNCSPTNTHASPLPWVVMLLYCTSWSYLFMGCRSLGNNIETSCLLVVLFLFSRGEETSTRTSASSVDMSTVLGFAVMALSVYVRPTSALLLAPMWLCHGIRRPVESRTAYVSTTLVTATLVCSVSVMIDNVLYSLQDQSIALVDLWAAMRSVDAENLSWSNIWDICTAWFPTSVLGITFVPINFIYFNIIQGYASTFGVKPVCWYFTEGLAVMLGLYCIVGLILAFTHMFDYIRCKDRPHHTRYTLPNLRSTLLWVYDDPQRAFVAISLGNLGLMSILSPHKEYRFMLPLMPALIIPLSQGILWWQHRRTDIKSSHAVGISALPLGIKLVVVLHSVFAVYMLQFHQGGAEIASQYVASIANRAPSGRVLHVQQLAPCFSFPGYAFTHSPLGSNVHLIMPICHAPKHSYMDTSADPTLTSELFMTAPVEFLRLSVELELANASLPDVIMSFDCYFTSISNDDDDDVDGGGDIVLWPERQRHAITRSEELEWKTLTDYYNTNYYVNKTWHHTHFQHDLDDPELKRRVVVLMRRGGLY